MVILAIVVAAGEGQSPTTRALVAASSEALGSDVIVQAHESVAPSDEDAARIEAATAARAVGLVLWLDAGHEHARLRVHVARTARWVERTIDFSAVDAPSERGRTLGFALASMLPDADPTLQAEAAGSGPPPARDARADVRPEAVATAVERSPPRSVGLSFLLSDGLAGPATGVGGAADFGFALADAMGLRVSAAVWRGTISEVSATDVTAYGGVGATWALVAARAGRPWGVGIGADALVVYQAVSHARTTGATQWQASLMPAADVTVEGRWRVARDVDLRLTARPEVVFGTVDVTVVSSAATRQVTLPALRGAVEAGVVLHF